MSCNLRVSYYSIKLLPLINGSMATPAELNYFIEVAQSQNLSRASERLGISQPSLSQAMKRLEDSMGIALLIRHRKGVTLTQAGKQLLAHAKQLVQYWNEVRAAALASHHAIQGRFTFGCHPSLGLTHLARFLPNLLLDNPKLEIDLTHDLSRKITEQVINLSIDIGLVVNPIQHPDLVIHKLKHDGVTFWKSPSIPTDYQDIYNGEAIIICDPNLSQTQWLLKNTPKIKYSRIIKSSNLEIIGKLAAEGCGIGILPGGIVTAMKKKLLIPLKDMPVFYDEICLVYRHEQRNIKAMNHIIEAIKNYFGALT